MKILYICNANVGRSQMAEALHKTIFPNDIVSSAGIEVNEHDGEIIGSLEKAKYVIEVMDEKDVDLRTYKRKQLIEKMANDAEKIFVITEPKNWPKFLVDNSKVEYWDIKDAKGMDYKFHIKTRDEIKRKIMEIKNA